MKQRAITISNPLNDEVYIEVLEPRNKEKALSISVSDSDDTAIIHLTQDELDELLDAIDTLRPARERKKK